ncbi:MAG: trypsin-like peptidase domain-containing protein [Eubacterium sp.]|nr:trypsin-like peptidase domain-containing protein [Eubacterium sp.]
MMNRRKRILWLLLVCLIMLSACGKEDKKEATYAEIEKMAAEGVFNVKWSTTEGEYTAGTSYVINDEKTGGKLLVTAFHYLWPDNADTFTGPELPSYVKGGEILYAQSGKDSGARLKCNLIIPDADAVPNIAKDVAAFTMTSGEGLVVLKLSDRRPEPGEKIYLLARLWDGEVINENCVYECQVVSCGADQIIYTLDKKYGSTMGASGGPLVDKYGEVIGMHMAGDGTYYYGHVTESFRKQIDGGYLSDITY